MSRRKKSGKATPADLQKSMPAFEKGSKPAQPNKKKFKTRSCELCTELGTEEMISCDLCSKWYHYACVNVESVSEEQDWVCPKCIHDANENLSRPRVSEQQQNVYTSNSAVASSHVVVSVSQPVISQDRTRSSSPVSVRTTATSNCQRFYTPNRFGTFGLDVGQQDLQNILGLAPRYVQSYSCPRMAPRTLNLALNRNASGQIGFQPSLNFQRFQANMGTPHPYRQSLIGQPVPNQMIQLNQFRLGDSSRMQNPVSSQQQASTMNFESNEIVNNACSINPSEVSHRMASIQKNDLVSRASSRRSLFSSRRQEIELAMLEKERELQRKRDNEYLNRKYRILSLNSMLMRGPDQLASLPDILRRFREKKFAITGDIKEMFHQVKIRDQDKQSQRFLWRNGDQSKVPDQYVMNVMTFGSKCSPTAAQYVKNANAATFQEEFPRAVDAIVNNHYVDDWLDGEDDEDKLTNLTNEVIMIHKNGGFEIRNFLSNSLEVKKTFGSQSQVGKSLNLEAVLGTERVLGMWWHTARDMFTFSLQYMKIDKEIADGTRSPTKREVLKILMSIFDPLGFLSHYLIHLKILLQEIWRSKMDWDEELSTPEMKAA